MVYAGILLKNNISLTYASVPWFECGIYPCD